MPTREYQHVTFTGNASFVFISVTDTQLHSLVCTVCGCFCAATVPLRSCERPRGPRGLKY